MMTAGAVHVLRTLRLQRPFWHYLEAFTELPYAFLLDSAAVSERLGRYSYLGADPFMIFRAHRIRKQADRLHQARVEICYRSGRCVRLDACAPFEQLQVILDKYRLDEAVYAGRPAPFLGGAVGYLGYEAGYCLEHLPDLGTDDLQLPDILLGFYDSVLIHDHLTGSTFLSVVGRGTSPRPAHAQAEQLADHMVRRIETFERDAPPDLDSPHDSSPLIPVQHASASVYAARVECARQHILSGKAFEICLTHRVEAACHVRPFRIYRELRRITPAPFAAYLELPEAAIASASPERFLRLDADRTVESRPIKGTRPRGKTVAEDHLLREELARSLKDQAENNMIVDLVRNDLGRVCEIGSRYHLEYLPEWAPDLMERHNVRLPGQ